MSLSDISVNQGIRQTRVNCYVTHGSRDCRWKLFFEKSIYSFSCSTMQYAQLHAISHSPIKMEEFRHKLCVPATRIFTKKYTFFRSRNRNLYLAEISESRFLLLNFITSVKMLKHCVRELREDCYCGMVNLRCYICNVTALR